MCHYRKAFMYYYHWSGGCFVGLSTQTQTIDCSLSWFSGWGFESHHPHRASSLATVPIEIWGATEFPTGEMCLPAKNVRRRRVRGFASGTISCSLRYGLSFIDLVQLLRWGRESSWFVRWTACTDLWKIVYKERNIVVGLNGGKGCSRLRVISSACAW